MSKLPTERKMVATAIALRAMLKEMNFPPSAEIAVTGFLFGLLLRELPESARPRTLDAFNDIITATVEEDDERSDPTPRSQVS
jgi:hypothetical protein